MNNICDCCGDTFDRNNRTLLTLKFPKNIDCRVNEEEEIILCPFCRDIIVSVLRNMGFYELIDINEEAKKMADELIKKSL
jgi:hypothetical protein